MTDPRPIGFFDSGVGGLSIWQAVIRRLPRETTIYFADSAHCPYGPRPLDELKAISAAIVRFLLRHNCKLIVVACNTASAAALEALRAEFDLPIVGMEPALKPAARSTQTGHIGVLATRGTVQGALFQHTLRCYANGIQVHVQIGEGLVEQVEAGHFDTPATEQLLRQYLEPMLVAGVDQIALGCTHYPLLMPLIQRIVDGRARVIDPAPAVARQVERLLMLNNALRAQNMETATGSAPAHVFYTTGQSRCLQHLAAVFNNRQTVRVVQVVNVW